MPDPDLFAGAPDLPAAEVVGDPSDGVTDPAPANGDAVPPGEGAADDAGADRPGRLGRLRARLAQPRWRRRRDRALRVLGVLAVVTAGSTVGTALVPSVPARVGPLSLDVRVVPSLDPGVKLLLPPAGRVAFDTHRAPLAVEAEVSEVDLEGARALIESPGRLRALQQEAPDALRTATLEASVLAAGYAMAGTLALSLLVHRRRWRRTAQVAATLSAVLVLSAAGTGLSFDSDRFAQPRFEGLLSQAPYIANQTSGLVQRLESYRSGLGDLVQGITTLYAKSGQLPVIPGNGGQDVITVLHISDIHLNPLGFDLTDRLVRQFGVDLVVDTGDITSWGTEVESATLARIRTVGVPYVFVRGNHDSLRTQRAVAANPNAVVLDGTVAEVGGLVLAGLGDPRFTPDAELTGAPSGSSSSSGSPSGAPPGSASASVTSVSPRPSTAAGAVVGGEDPEVVEGRRLAGVIRAWNQAHPTRPVAVAAFHEPAGAPPMDGVVPLVLSGHLHRRSVQDLPSGTRLMIEGSTGGAGFDSLSRAAGDEPVPLAASVLYFARSGPRAGQLLAYDQVTVGGFGLASVALDRTVLRPGKEPALAPGELRGTAAACAPPSGTPGTFGSPGTPGIPGAAGGTRSGGSPGTATGGSPDSSTGVAGPTASTCPPP